ncbi:hypothetical protein [Peptoniphilus harei]|uniref:Uncharacterized protein n=1 Tax=Peptoniphilus harei TaxID=54005 RepID=A0A943XTZ5_9FIRM|nr:hypothetical protein [Peptoniphilus harei]MBS6535394.1 hypothetical protein [Peptoniphilus harei]
MILQNISDLNLNFNFSDEIETEILYEKLKCNKIIFLVSKEEILLPSTFVAIYADEFIKAGIKYQDYIDNAVKVALDFIKDLKVSELEAINTFLNDITKEICYSLIIKDFLKKENKTIFENYGLLTLEYNSERESYRLENTPNGDSFFTKIKFFELLTGKERVLNLFKINKENYPATYFKDFRISFGLTNFGSFYPVIPAMLRDVENSDNGDLKERLSDYEHNIETDSLEEEQEEYISQFLQSEFAVDVYLFDEEKSIGTLTFELCDEDGSIPEEDLPEGLVKTVLRVNQTSYLVTAQSDIKEEPFGIEV